MPFENFVLVGPLRVLLQPDLRAVARGLFYDVLTFARILEAGLHQVHFDFDLAVLSRELQSVRLQIE